MQLDSGARTGTKAPSAIAFGKAYYVSQVCGWGIYGVLQYLLSRTRGLPTVVLVMVSCGVGMVGTHLLRAYASRRGWWTIPQLIFPFAIAALLIPLVMSAARAATSVLLLRSQPAPAPPWVAFAHYFQAVLVVSLWCAAFLSANEVQRRRVAEMEALRLALVAQVAQFRALRSQLNPHFLFNCMNSPRELIDEDSDRAKQVVSRLSDLLRYALRADRVETVSLKEELRAVEYYLSLEKVRFEERLRVNFDIDPTTLEAKLPPMLLQTLAENGVKHGIAQLPAGGNLSIVAHVLDGSLRISVTNSGTLSRATDGSSGVGLENARERLRLIYGDSASLKVTPLGDANVCAAVVIPVSSNGAVC